MKDNYEERYAFFCELFGKYSPDSVRQWGRENYPAVEQQIEAMSLFHKSSDPVEDWRGTVSDTEAPSKHQRIYASGGNESTGSDNPSRPLAA